MQRASAWRSANERIAHAHRQRVAAARAAAQHLHRLAGNETQLGQAAQHGRVQIGRMRTHAAHGGTGAVGKLVQKHGSSNESLSHLHW